MSFLKRKHTNVTQPTPAETRFELLRLLYTDGTLFASVGTPAFNVAIDLERRGMCDVRVGGIWKPAITITSRGRLLCEEIDLVSYESVAVAQEEDERAYA